MVSRLQAVIIGLLQGIIEWLPISSEGNLMLLSITVFGIEPLEALQYSIFLHLGTGIAALLYFRNDVIAILKGNELHSEKLRMNLTFITIISSIIGLLIYTYFTNTSGIGEILIIITGFALIFSGLIQRLSGGKGLREFDSLTTLESIILACAQGLSIIPGISRSGITTSTLLFMKNSGESSFKYSFIMSIPVSFIAAIGIFYLESPPLNSIILYSIIASFITGYLTINVLLTIAKKISFWKISIGLGLLALLSYFFPLGYSLL
jgi:undecaprenyl-diphosphatase